MFGPKSQSERDVGILIYRDWFLGVNGIAHFKQGNGMGLWLLI